MTLTDKLNTMVGKTFMYNTRHYKILSFRISPGENNVQIATDKKWFDFHTNLIDAALKQFLPVADLMEVNSLQIMPKKDEMNDLKTIILNNIKKVQKDKNYVGQANSINKSMNTLINMAKTEISLLKLSRNN